jgi:site-specific DNA-methyltransferase (adenine-specific)
MTLTKPKHRTKNYEWFTPYEIYDKLNKLFGPFTLDPCTTSDNPLGTPKFYTEEDDGLSKDWSEEVVYMNPPYGRTIGDWIWKAMVETEQHGAVVVALLPVHTGPRWFQQMVPEMKLLRRLEDATLDGIEIFFWPGRITFVGADNPAQFDSMIVIFS